jgi:lysine 6-dehydrogenase
MKVLVVGVGLQGRAVVHDLERSRWVTELIAADLDPEAVAGPLARLGCTKTRVTRIDVSREQELSQAVREIAPRLVVCMVPPASQVAVARAALEAGAHFVSTSYTGGIAQFDDLARQRGLALLPEMGLDPGIDLVMARSAIGELDEVHGLHMWGGGVPEPAAANNPWRYKITWTFEGVLQAYRRDARLLRDGLPLVIPGDRIFESEHTGSLNIPQVGTLEVYPNGDALPYAQVYGLGESLRDLGRFTLRWPGHCAFWLPIAVSGLLSDQLQEVGGTHVAPRALLSKLLTPRLQYAEQERDLAVLRVHAWGKKGDQPHSVTLDMIDRRDLSTGLFAMNRTVGYTASVGAQMILSGEIPAVGLLSPARDVPPVRLFEQLRARGIQFVRRVN